eukprot:TRINITY_DN27027_c0_g1_i2.p1 TRINITY_DN27027_c0_g1~~TRINITY_DN27027_c0_g1_i2.p1  ORF type:complete len:186 (+),score=27.41 TRINITY_DN27027_c0_g1_i2:79-636(+)
MPVQLLFCLHKDAIVVWFFFFSSRRRHTRCREVSWARRCVQETGINAEYMGGSKTSTQHRCRKSGYKLTKVSKVLQDFSEYQPETYRAKYRTLTVVSITVRGKKTIELLKRGLKVIDLEFLSRCFVEYGNFEFKIKEHITQESTYPDTSIYRINFYLMLNRPGLRIKSLEHYKANIGKMHTVITL